MFIEKGKEGKEKSGYYHVSLSCVTAKEEKGENKNTRFSMARIHKRSRMWRARFRPCKHRMRKTEARRRSGKTREGLVGSTKLGARFPLRGSSSWRVAWHHGLRGSASRRRTPLDIPLARATLLSTTPLLYTLSVLLSSPSPSTLTLLSFSFHFRFLLDESLFSSLFPPFISLSFPSSLISPRQ